MLTDIIYLDFIYFQNTIKFGKSEYLRLTREDRTHFISQMVCRMVLLTIVLRQVSRFRYCYILTNMASPKLIMLGKIKRDVSYSIKGSDLTKTHEQLNAHRK